PCIYYGDEVGMTGANDPYCRGAFPWHDRESWNEDLLDFHKRAIAMRHAYPALRTGSFEALLARGSVYAFRRVLADEEMIVVFNVAEERVSVDIPLGESSTPGAYTAVWGEGTHTAQAQRLPGVTIGGRGALVLKRAG
ncbi:MAG: alpha-glucosidase C-terminal domain-containing protein, partial [Caldilineaceae bacterium]|nr:alpha-glucosidase C-terminal domain-containing protein [Caldilineaceae bacterium]